MHQLLIALLLLLAPVQEYHGFVHVEEGKPGEILFLRDHAAYEAFIQRIPTTQISKRQPAPPSHDPLLKRPPIDFATHMAVVATSRTIHEDVRIVELDQVERTVQKGAEHAARPYGVGQYHLVVVTK